jgi:hypothetical protein
VLLSGFLLEQPYAAPCKEASENSCSTKFVNKGKKRKAEAASLYLTER